MAEPLDLNVLSDRINQIETRAANFEGSINAAIATMMSKIDEVLTSTNIGVTPTPNRGGAASATAPSMSLLEQAARGNSDGILHILEDQTYSSNFHERADNGDTALHIAAREGHLRTVIILLGKVARVDDPGHLLRTPLHCAARNGHLKVVQCLLDAGAQFDAKDGYGDTPMALATENKHKHIVDLLAQRMTQLPQATFEMGSLSHQDLANYMKENGVSIESCNAKGKNSLFMQAARSGRWEIVDFLFARGFSVTECKDPKECLLVLAARAGQVDAVCRLLRDGAASEADQVKFGLGEAKSAAVVCAFYEVVPDAVRGDAGKRALIQAANEGRLEPLQALLDLGVAVNSKGDGGKTALFWAAKEGQIACLKELLRRGAASDADQVKFGLGEAKSAAVVFAFHEVVPDAVRGDAGKWALREAAKNGQLEPLQALLDLGVDVNSRDAISWAAANGHMACLTELLRRGADVNAKVNNGNTLLHIAVSWGKEDCVRALLETGASKAAKNNEGKTPRQMTSSGSIHKIFDTVQ